MTAVLRIYSAGRIDGNTGNDQRWGSLTEPTREVTLAADKQRSVQEITLAVGEVFTVWEWSADRPGFDFIGISVLDEGGYVKCAWKADKPTSTTDTTPLGTAKAWHRADIDDKCEFRLASDELTVNLTQADANGDNSGTPVQWDDAGEVDGRIYKVQIKNPDAATEAVRVQLVVAY
jgi:hypothetical protein